VALAVQTGVPAREWLRDPAAMVTAVEVLQEIAEAIERQREG
jgi:hypothetical protein